MIGQYLKDLTRVLAIGGGFASIPLLAALAKLEPPWPPAISYVSALFVLVSSLVAWEWTRQSQRQRRRAWVMSGAAMMIAGLLLYLTLYSMFVESSSGSNVRVVRGYQCTRNAAKVYGSECPNLPRDALRNSEWVAAELWTRGSITLVRLALTASWILFVTGQIVVVGSIVAGRNVIEAKRRRNQV